MGLLLQPLDEVLSARSKVRLLRALLAASHPLSGREAARLARVSRVPAARSLDELVALGIVQRQITAGQHLYSVNRESELVRHGLEPLFGAERERVGGLFEALRSVLERSGAPVEGAWIFGSAARDEDTMESDLDLLVITPDVASEEQVHASLVNAASELDRRFGVRLSPVVLPRERLLAMHAAEHALVSDVLREGRRVLGTDLERLLR